MKKENVNESLVVMDNETLEAIIEDNLYLVPKNKRKEFDTLSLEEKRQKIAYYQDRAVKIEQWRQSAKVVNKVKDIFEKRKATIDDAKEVLNFTQEFIDNFRQRQIEDIDKQIQELEEMKLAL